MFRKPSNLVVLAVVTILVGGIARAADPDLVGWWKLDEGSGTVIADSSNNGIEGTVTGGAWVSPGWHGGGFCLELADDAYVDLGNPASLNFGTGDWSITAWVKNTMTGTGDENKGTIYANGGDNSGGHRYTLAISEVTEGVITLTTDDNATKLQATATTLVNDDEWHFVVGMRSGTSILVYTDGLEEGSNTTVPAGYDLSGTSQHDAYLGAITANDTSSLFKTYDGLIDDVRVFKRALSQAEIDFVMQDIGVTETAYDPVPGDEATDVPRDVVLSWSPGELAVTHDVYLGTAFDDVNDASRGNPMDVLVSQGQSDLAYGPGRLEFGQLYYWRVDEVNGAPDNTVFKGEVWSFAVEPYTYAVENVVVATDAVSDPVSGIENIINGSGLSDDGLHSTDSTDMWQTVTGTAVPFSIQYELDQVYKLDEMLVWNYNVQFESVLGFGLKDVTIEYSADGETWTSLGDIELAQATAQSGYAANNAIDFGGAAVKYVKMTVNSNFGGLPQFGLSEVRFMYIPVAARQPEPADGATDLSLASVLNWRAGREAAVHDVYLGTDAENLELAGSAAEASYDPGTLDLDTTYYWRVDEVNETEAISLWEGPVWRFTTQEFLVVDDFESYTDDEGNRIYEFWEDGFLNDTGSTVGYFEAPFTEQTIVNSGGQSMPLFYDNAGVSTAEAELSLSQDWTTNGIKSLSLSFYGDPNNSGGQLYVIINGTKISYDGDLLTAAWQVMTVDLSTVGGNLSNVTSLIIGVEGAGASGIVYIDDIRLYGAPLEPNYSYDGDALDDAWVHDNGSDEWDGTGPGEGRPGGVAALTEDGVTFLRIQDTGDPRDYGMDDPGSNRKVYLTRQTDAGLDGLRLEFSLRVATAAPLDDMHPDGGAGIEPWPAEGIAYHVRDGGKGMIGVAEAGLGVISFSLARGGQPGLEDVTGDVLVMNNLVGTEPSGDVDTEDTAETIVARNWVAVDDVTQWNTFTVDIAAGGAGTHTVSISVNGGEAEVFDVTVGDGLEGEGSYLAIGSSGTGGITAFDVDYVSYYLLEE